MPAREGGENTASGERSRALVAVYAGDDDQRGTGGISDDSTDLTFTQVLPGRWSDALGAVDSDHGSVALSCEPRPREELGASTERSEAAPREICRDAHEVFLHDHRNDAAILHDIASTQCGVAASIAIASRVDVSGDTVTRSRCITSATVSMC